MNALLLITLLGFAAAQTAVAIDGGSSGTSTGQLLYRINPTTRQSSGPTQIMNLPNGDQLLALATYPSNGGILYGISKNTNGIYRVDPNSGAATLTSTLNCQGIDKSNPTLSADFNPNTGALTILTLLQGQTTNLYTADLATGNCSPQTPAQFAANSGRPAAIKPAAIFYRFNGVNVAPTLFIVEAASRTLSTVSPNGGALNVVGDLSTGFLSGVGGSSLIYGTTPAGVSVLYNPDNAQSAYYTINLNSGSTSQDFNISGITTNLLGLAVVGNNYPAGVLQNSNTVTPTTTGNGNGNDDNDNNGNRGSGVIVVTAGQAVATATVTNTDVNTFTTTANVADTNGLSTRTITVIPNGAGTFTKSIGVYENGGTSRAAIGTVSENGLESVSTTGVVTIGGSTATAGVTVQFPAGQSTGVASYSFNGPTATFSRSAVVLVGGVEAVTLPTFAINGANQAQNAVVTVGDSNGRTSTQLATINLQYGRFNSASLAQVSVVAVVAAVALLF